MKGMNKIMNNVKILDCTLRDGGYQNQWKFGQENEIKIVNSLIEANIDIVECGLLVKGNYIKGNTKFSSLEDVKDVMPQNREGKIFTCLMNYGDFDANSISDYDGKTIEGIRVAFHKNNVNEALKACRTIKMKGYKVFIQPMVSLGYSDNEFLQLIQSANAIKPFAFYIVDSFGIMKRKDLIRLFYMVEHNLDKDIAIGVHLHNNLQLAYSNAQAVVDIPINHSLIIDTSIMGMGRGAGNLNTELFIEYINSNMGGNYKVKPILRVIDEVLNIFYNKCYWGYSLPNYLSASYNAHPDYASFLVDKNTLTVENMDDIFSMMDENKKMKFDKDYMESLYFNYMSKDHYNEKNLSDFTNRLFGKKILLIAPGRSSEEEFEKIARLASDNEVISIGVNFKYAHCETDYIFLSNLRRFQEMSSEQKSKMITTSNIPEREGYLQLDYSDLLNEVEAVKDNAAMMLINFLIKVGVNTIYLAGLDGYSHNMNENYAKEYLQLVTRKDILDEMNEGMNFMLRKFSQRCDISFVTKSKYLSI